MGRGLLSAEAVGGKVIPEREDEGASKDAVEQKAKETTAVTTTISRTSSLPSPYPLSTTIAPPLFSSMNESDIS